MDFDYSFGEPVPIVQSNSTVISPRLKGLYVHTAAAGTVKIMSKGKDATINVPAGNTVLPFGNITMVYDTGTTIADTDMFGIR
jgi:hypothetical protein